MEAMSTSHFLKKLLSTRTAPFRECWVRECLEEELTAHQIPHFRDPHGNIVVGARNRAEYTRTLKRGTPAQPARFFIAHMDHPGFHVMSVNGTVLEGTWHGGTPVAHIQGGEVWLKSLQDPVWEGHGTVLTAEKAEHGRSLSKATIQPSQPLPTNLDPNSLFGSFKFRAPFWEDGELLRANACDDLIGCYAILQAARKTFAKGKPKSGQPPFLALLSRAEEVGFIGTIAHLELGWWKASKTPPLVVSLETSRQLPGAEIGKGPIVRIGDKFTAFSPGPMRRLAELAQKLLPEQHQRRIMDGGSCEGSAASVYGLPVIALSVPLGNYHNQSIEGGEDSRGELGPAPEFVHSKDVERLLTLVQAIASRAYDLQAPWAPTLKLYRGALKKFQTHLRSAP